MASWKKFSKAKYHELQRVTGQLLNVIPYLKNEGCKEVGTCVCQAQVDAPQDENILQICSCKSVQNTEAHDQDLLKIPHFVLELSDALFCPSLPPTYTMLNSSQQISLVFLKNFFSFWRRFLLDDIPVNTREQQSTTEKIWQDAFSPVFFSCLSWISINSFSNLPENSSYRSFSFSP